MPRSDSSSNQAPSSNNLRKFKLVSEIRNSNDYINAKNSGYFTEKRVTEEPPLDASSEENHVNPLDSPTFQKNFASIEANVVAMQQEQNET